jgi:hypothetical protein
VRSAFFANAKACFVAVVSAGLLNLPALAAGLPPLGMVVAAQDARLANAKAVSGADLYPGDVLETDPGGSLRLKIETAQVYLLGSSSAILVREQEQGKVRAQLKAGTLGFSTANPEGFEIQTPLGLVHGAAGQRAFGQVTLLAPNHALISVYEGTFLLDGNCSSHAVNAGENYDVTASPSEPCTSQVVHATTSPISGSTLLKAGIAAGAVAGILAFAWHQNSDTCSNTTSC